MRVFNTHLGKVIPLKMDHVDTDLIIPAQFLKQVTEKGYGESLFKRLRDERPDFIFNNELFQSASILVANENFGCGSSREHAVWALSQWGIQVVIAESFADIFHNNAFKNGLLLIKQEKSVIENIQSLAIDMQGEFELKVDLQNSSLHFADQSIPFSCDEFNQYCLLNGVDELSYLLNSIEDIRSHQMDSAEHHYFLKDSNQS